MAKATRTTRQRKANPNKLREAIVAYLRALPSGTTIFTRQVEDAVKYDHTKDGVLNNLYRLSRSDDKLVKVGAKVGTRRTWLVPPGRKTLGEDGNSGARRLTQNSERDMGSSRSAKQNALRRGAHSPELIAATLRSTDLNEPPARVQSTTYRILRDTRLAREVKMLHEFKCQICGETLGLPDGRCYAEAHHIRPLGRPHGGLDVTGNILCLCPNHHAELDYAVSEISIEKLRKAAGHPIGEEFVSYHNALVSQRRAHPDEVSK